MKLKVTLVISGLLCYAVGKVVRTSVTGVLGKDVVLPCKIPDKSYEVREWMSRKQGPIARNNHVLKRPDKFSLMPPQLEGDWSLKIVNVQLDDEDSYHCNAGFYRTRVRLTVEVAPYFEGHAGNIEKSVTRDVRKDTLLTCDPKGIPTPDKTWYRIDQRNRNQMHLEGHGVFLTVLEDDTASEQTYLCVANNTHGHVTASFKIETLAPSRKTPKKSTVSVFKITRGTTIPEETTSRTQLTTNMQNITVTESVTTEKPRKKPNNSKVGAEPSSSGISGTTSINAWPQFLNALVLLAVGLGIWM